MLIPKKVKHRKWHKGRSRTRTVETRGLDLAFGSFGIQALESVWLNSRQIEAARKSITHFTKRGGKPVTKMPPEVTLGGGKGNVDHYVFPVKPGRMLFEIDGVKEEVAREAFRRAGHKLPVKTRVVIK